MLINTNPIRINELNSQLVIENFLASVHNGYRAGSVRRHSQETVSLATTFDRSYSIQLISKCVLVGQLDFVFNDTRKKSCQAYKFVY